jgi:hypothetical protein
MGRPSHLFSIFSCLIFFSFFFFRRNEPRDKVMEIKPVLRRAIKSDVEAISRIALASMALDPQWPYRFPLASVYPEDHKKFTRMRYTEYLSNQDIGAFDIMLAELPSNEDPSTTIPIAFAIWQLPGSHIKRTGNKQKPCTWS